MALPFTQLDVFTDTLTRGNPLAVVHDADDLDDDRLAFAAPDVIRGGPVDPAKVDEIVAGLNLDPQQVLDAQWCDNGPGWSAFFSLTPGRSWTSTSRSPRSAATPWSA